MNSALKIIDTAITKLTQNLETMRRRRRREKSEYYADAMPGITINFN